MTLKLGTTDATLRLGDAAYPTKAYLGDTLVAATVPGAPTIALAEFDGSGTAIEHSLPDDGGSAITGYKYYFDGAEYTPSLEAGPGEVYFTGEDFTGVIAEVSAVNAIGEGPKSAPFTVTAA